MFWLRSPVPRPKCSTWAQLAWQWYYPDAASPQQWDCCEPSSGRVSPRGYCKALWLPVYSTDSTPGVLFPILIWSIATWPWSAVVWMRVPPMKQMLEYHTAMVGSDYELRGWLGIQSLRCVREENCLSCLHRHVHVWIVDCFISFPYAANCWFRYDDQSAERLHSCDICFLTRCMAWWRGVVQVNPGDGISVLPINIGACSKMLILLGKTYLERLWCVWEELFTLFTLQQRAAGTGERISIVCMDYSTGLNFS